MQWTTTSEVVLHTDPALYRTVWQKALLTLTTCLRFKEMCLLFISSLWLLPLLLFLPRNIKCESSSRKCSVWISSTEHCSHSPNAALGEVAAGWKKERGHRSGTQWYGDSYWHRSYQSTDMNIRLGTFLLLRPTQYQHSHCTCPTRWATGHPVLAETCLRRNRATTLQAVFEFASFNNFGKPLVTRAGERKS